MIAEGVRGSFYDPDLHAELRNSVISEALGSEFFRQETEQPVIH